MEIRKVPFVAQPNMFAQGTNADAVITLPAQPGRHGFGDEIVWSYTGQSVVGRLTILGSGFNVDVDITTAGVGRIQFFDPLVANGPGQVVITLYAGGVGVVGKLNVLGHAIY